MEFSGIALNGFFTLSGFLIYPSLVYSKSLSEYIWKRFIRIYPAFFVNILLITLLIGPIIYEGEFIDYFGRPDFQSYLINNLMLRIQYEYANLFATNPYPLAVNGSLWTIPYEIICYLIIIPLMIIRSHKLTGLSFMIFTLIAISIYRFSIMGNTNSVMSIPYFNMPISHLYNFGSFFLVGAIYSFLKDSLSKFKVELFCLSFCLTAISLFLSMYSFTEIMLFPTLILFIGIDELGKAISNHQVWRFFIWIIPLWFFRTAIVALFF